ncbi:DUF4340 domain-containing protein [Desulfosudis oleivorans]|uniref:DUF4340 domain-containing protein n=1 Tax=Desulfosudis oleivorans (strain DSM 6200 / JCM 39069 / Hxd3) TaxID=96561 RepID=A8ZTT8_DESOH|nr:DUF4340 domain-containing protein [Desulfosudis oleivorans]ABW67871.1 hypothetical protein Dole_2067 [Desulfosudis oleivorans Hxd3]
MKIKTEYLVLVALIAGLSLFLWFRNSDRVLYELPDTGGLKKEQIARIEVRAPEQAPLVLEKKGNVWFLPSGAPAKPADTVRMVEAVSDLALTTLVSERDDLVRYDLSADKAVTVTASAPDGKPLRTIAVGKTAPSHNHTFVRIDEDPRIYHARGRLSGIFDKTADALTDRRVLDVDRATLTRITVEQAGESRTLVKSAAEDTLWITDEGETVDPSAVSGFLDAILRLECITYRETAGPENPGEPVLTVTLMDENAHTLSVFPPKAADGSNYPARSSRTDLGFLLSADTVENLFKTVSGLAPGAEDTPDAKE